MKFDVSILLEPTSPLRSPKDVEQTIAALINGDYLAAATVSKAPAHFTPHKCLTINDKGFINFFLKNGAQYSLRQTIPNYYYRNGVCYAVKRETVVDRRQIIEERCIAVIIDRLLVNIDETSDLELAEFLFKKDKREDL